MAPHWTQTIYILFQVFELVDFLGKLPTGLRPFGMIFEDALGNAVPEECGAWAKYAI